MNTFIVFRILVTTNLRYQIIIVMETMNYAEHKISLAQTIFALDDINKIVQIKSYINELVQLDNNDFDAKLLTFKEWNKQFGDEYKLDDFSDQYGMTVGEFRLQIYNSEKSEGMSKKDFFQKLDNLK